MKITRSVKSYLSEIGSLGGRVKSERKTRANRINATRPRKKHMSSIDNVVAGGQQIHVAIAKPIG